MSKDISLFAIRKARIKKGIIKDKSPYEGGYLTYDEARIPKCLKGYAQKVLVRYECIDYHKACMERFGKDYESITWLGDPLVTGFRDESGVFGRLSNEKLKKYAYTEDEVKAVVPVKYLGGVEDPWAFELLEGLYSAKQILEEMLRIIEMDCECYSQTIESLAAAYKRIGKGGKIYVCIE